MQRNVSGIILSNTELNRAEQLRKNLDNMGEKGIYIEDRALSLLADATKTRKEIIRGGNTMNKNRISSSYGEKRQTYPRRT